MDTYPIYGASLCSGIGALDLAVSVVLPGYRCILYCEREITACEILVARMEEGSIPEALIWDDLATLPASRFRGVVHILTAGLPCTPYSVAGKRLGDKDERYIWPAFFRVIREMRPAVVLLENVPAFTSWFRPVGEELSGLGYEFEAGLFSASECGASHTRLRFFALCWLPEDSRSVDIIRHLAYRQGGGRRELRQPSRGNGFADAPWHERDGSHRQAGAWRGVREAGDELADTAGDDQRHGSERIAAGEDQERRGERTWRGGLQAGDLSVTVADAGDRFLPLAGRRPGEPALQAARSGVDGGGRPVENPGCAGNGWSAESPEEYRRRPSGDDSGAGRTLGNADQPGLEGRGEREYGADQRPAWEAGDSELADTAGLRCGGYSEITDCSGETAPSQRPQEPQEYKREPQRRNPELADPRCEPGRYAGLPLFAPGPNDPKWPAIIRDFPELSPAISQEEVESHFCNVVAGLANMVVHERTDALRAIGNGVVCIQGAAALVTLARRSGLIY